MKNTKEIQPILTAIFCLNRTGERNEQIDKVCDYAFRRLFGANTNLLSLACIGQTKEDMEKQVQDLLEQETEFKKYLEEYRNYYQTKGKPYVKFFHVPGK